jgi:methionyl-tRNA synthetase
MTISVYLPDAPLNRALDDLWRVVGAGNRYVDEEAPWSLRNTDPDRSNTILYVLAETIRHVAILCQPFIPTAASHLLDQLGVPGDHRTFAMLADAPLKPGNRIPPPKAVFPRHMMVTEGPIVGG